MFFLIVAGVLQVSWGFFFFYSKYIVYSFANNCQSNFCSWPVNESEEAFNGNTDSQVKEKRFSLELLGILVNSCFLIKSHSQTNVIM